MKILTRFNKRIDNIPPEILGKIAKIDELKGSFLVGVKMGSKILNNLKQSVLIISSGSSTRIEGSKMSDEDIEKMMKGISIQTFRDRDRQEVQGYIELLQNVFDAWQKISFSEGMIKHFHKELLKYVERDKFHRGNYKKTENRVIMIDEVGQSVGVLFDTTAPYLIPKQMLELVEWTKISLEQKKYHPVLIIANFIVEFLKIHPFTDGNGRLSRILTNFLLLKTGYLFIPYVSHEKIIEDNKPDYYLALRRSQKTFKTETETILPWLEFFLNSLILQSETAVRLLSETDIEHFLSEKQTAVWDYLQEFSNVSRGEIAKKTRIPPITINQILNKLLILKKIEKFGEGRATRYRVNRPLPSILK